MVFSRHSASRRVVACLTLSAKALLTWGGVCYLHSVVRRHSLPAQHVCPMSSFKATSISRLVVAQKFLYLTRHASLEVSSPLTSGRTNRSFERARMWQYSTIPYSSISIFISISLLYPSAPIYIYISTSSIGKSSISMFPYFRRQFYVGQADSSLIGTLSFSACTFPQSISIDPIPRR